MSHLAPLQRGAKFILSCMQMRHGECKTVGGKLVAVTVSVDDDGTAQSCHISGDFFIESVSDAESHALLRDLEQALISEIHCGPYWTLTLVAKLSAQMKLPSKPHIAEP